MQPPPPGGQDAMLNCVFCCYATPKYVFEKKRDAFLNKKMEFICKSPSGNLNPAVGKSTGTLLKTLSSDSTPSPTHTLRPADEGSKSKVTFKLTPSDSEIRNKFFEFFLAKILSLDNDHDQAWTDQTFSTKLISQAELFAILPNGNRFVPLKSCPICSACFDIVAKAWELWARFQFIKKQMNLTLQSLVEKIMNSEDQGENVSFNLRLGNQADAVLHRYCLRMRNEILTRNSKTEKPTPSPSLSNTSERLNCTSVGVGVGDEQEESGTEVESERSSQAPRRKEALVPGLTIGKTAASLIAKMMHPQSQETASGAGKDTQYSGSTNPASTPASIPKSITINSANGESQRTFNIIGAFKLNPKIFGNSPKSVEKPKFLQENVTPSQENVIVSKGKKQPNILQSRKSPIKLQSTKTKNIKNSGHDASKHSAKDYERFLKSISSSPKQPLTDSDKPSATAVASSEKLQSDAFNLVPASSASSQLAISKLVNRKKIIAGPVSVTSSTSVSVSTSTKATDNSVCTSITQDVDSTPSSDSLIKRRMKRKQDHSEIIKAINKNSVLDILDVETDSEPSESEMIDVVPIKKLRRHCKPDQTDADTNTKSAKPKPKKKCKKLVLRFQCKFCNTRFSDEKRYISHCEKRHPDTILCFLCGISFDKQFKYLEHQFELHEATADKVHTCKFCEKSFSEEIILSYHYKMHTVGINSLGLRNIVKPISCNICQLDFESNPAGERNLQLHSKRHDLNSKDSNPENKDQQDQEEGGFKCAHCSKRFNQYNSLRWHEYRDHPEIFVHSCLHPNCDKKFSKVLFLKIHKRCHLKLAKYFCDVCNFYFESSDLLSNHLQRHTGEPRFHCTDCNTPHPCKAAYETHLAERHPAPDTVPNLSCPNCSKKFYTKRMLNTHVASQHKGPKDKKCEQCPGSDHKFDTKGLERHIKSVHERKFDVECNICGKIMSGKQGLRLHVRHFHNQIREHKCHICGMAFYFKLRLNQHLMTHGQIPKPHQCDLCDDKFIEKRGLIRHKNRVHNVPYPPTAVLTKRKRLNGVGAEDADATKTSDGSNGLNKTSKIESSTSQEVHELPEESTSDSDASIPESQVSVQEVTGETEDDENYDPTDDSDSDYE